MKRLLCLVSAMWLLLFSRPAMAQFEVGQTLTISMPGGEKTLSVENSRIDENTPCQLWSQTYTPSQSWVVCENPRGGFSLKNSYSGLYLGKLSIGMFNIPLGLISEQKTTLYGNWYFEPVEGKEDTYILYAGSAKTTCLATSKDQEVGSPITVQRTSNTEPERIQWEVKVINERPSTLTQEVCDEMMVRWKKQYYHKATVGYVIGKGGWWGDAEMFEIVLDALETTGKSEYADMFQNLYLNFCNRNRSDWRYNNYNDDIAWMCIACARAYLLTGRAEYRVVAKSNFDAMYARANAWGDNTLIWCMENGRNNGTNSCVNGPACVAACYLAQCFNDETYYEKARATYAGHRALLYNLDGGRFNGQVYDCYDQVNKKMANYWSSTYNQGTSLGAALMLYHHYGDALYKEDADAIIRWTADNLADKDGIIKVCQTATGDLTGFKGILMRYVRNYAEEMNAPQWYDWLANNAFRAFNNRNTSGISMSAWLTKTPDNFEYSDGGNFREDGVGAMTALSAAFNAHLSVVRGLRVATEEQNAWQFDYLRGTRVSENAELGRTVAGPLRNKHFVGYRRVDFGDGGLNYLNIYARFMRINTTLRVRVDKADGTLLCQYLCPADSVREWHFFDLPLDTLLTGVHDIYFEAESSASGDLFLLDRFHFAAEQGTDVASVQADGPSVKVVAGSLRAHAAEPATLTVCDLAGRQVAAYNVPAGTSVHVLSPLRGGTYVAVLRCGDRSVTCKFVWK